jgi:hypothetical protein
MLYAVFASRLSFGIPDSYIGYGYRFSHKQHDYSGRQEAHVAPTIRVTVLLAAVASRYYYELIKIIF